MTVQFLFKYVNLNFNLSFSGVCITLPCLNTNVGVLLLNQDSYDHSLAIKPSDIFASIQCNQSAFISSC